MFPSIPFAFSCPIYSPSCSPLLFLSILQELSFLDRSPSPLQFTCPPLPVPVYPSFSFQFTVLFLSAHLSFSFRLPIPHLPIHLSFSLLTCSSQSSLLLTHLSYLSLIFQCFCPSPSLPILLLFVTYPSPSFLRLQLNSNREKNEM